MPLFLSQQNRTKTIQQTESRFWILTPNRGGSYQTWNSRIRSTPLTGPGTGQQAVVWLQTTPALLDSQGLLGHTRLYAHKKLLPVKNTNSCSTETRFFIQGQGRVWYSTRLLGPHSGYHSQHPQTNLFNYFKESTHNLNNQKIKERYNLYNFMTRDRKSMISIDGKN